MSVTTLTRWDGGSPDKIRALARQAAPHVLRAGAEHVRLARIFTGPHVGQWLVSIRWSSWEAYGKGATTISADADYQALIAEVLTISRRAEHTMLLGVDL